MEKQKCVRCKEEKEIVLFKPNKKACRKCERNKIKKKVNKFQSVNLGLEGLDKNLENIYVISKYFKYNYYTTLDKAIEYVQKGIAQVYSPDTIYKIIDEDDQFVREEVLERDLFICKYCGKYGNTVDHIVPRSKGGQYVAENLFCACLKCNSDKDDLNKEEFEKYKGRIKDLKIIKKQEIEMNVKIGELINHGKKENMNKLEEMLIELKNKSKHKWY